jgi:acetyltransferase-like isoleucine patch superfamily enzyme/dTDP-4-dehydrorhamnose 3,5-epimerase-like enzyme
VSDAIDPSARCEAETVGDGARVGAFSVIERGAVLGRDVVVGHHVVIGAGVQVGDGARIGDGAIVMGPAQLEAGVRLGARALLSAPAATEAARPAAPTIVRAGAAVGDGAVLIAGVEIGATAVVDTGAVVDVSVPRRAVVAGNPAAITGYVGIDGPAPLHPFRFDDTELAPGERELLETAVGGVQVHRLPEVRDLRGSLVAGEIAKGLPFVPRRYFFVYDVPGSEIRGEHAHYECHQFLVPVSGRLHVIADDGRSRQEFELDNKRTGLYLPPMVWGVQYRYSRDCVLLVLASHEYDPADYVRDYSLFLSEVGKRP